MRAADNKLDAEPHKKARHDSLTHEQAVVRLRKKSSIIANLYFENEKSKRKCRDLEKKLKCLESKLNAAIQKGKWPKFIRAFQHAASNGNLPTQQLQNLLEDIAKSLQGKHKWHADSKSFYTCLLNIGSPAVTNFVSKISLAWTWEL